MEKLIEAFEEAKETLKKKGHEYYEKDRTATIIFWELEAVLDKMLKTLKTPERGECSRVPP